MSTYEENVKKWKQAYTEILEVCEKYPDFSIYDFRDIDRMKSSAKDHLLLIEWYEKYGLKLSHDHQPASYNYFDVGDYRIFSFYSDAEAQKDSGSGKYISWPDDDRQPNNEWLFKISFPTGAYIFGDDYHYQQDLFQEFIKELKTYNPDYSDSHNESYYWKLENAKPIHEAFSTILEKYRKRNVSELNARKADRLRKELAKLESGI